MRFLPLLFLCTPALATEAQQVQVNGPSAIGSCVVIAAEQIRERAYADGRIETLLAEMKGIVAERDALRKALAEAAKPAAEPPTNK